MNQGHLRSILPQRGGVSPVDNNTVALFHYDEHAKDSIKGIMPIGKKHAVQLPGLAGEYIDLGDPDLSTLSNCTVEFWCKTSSNARWLFMGGQTTAYYLMAVNGSNGFYHSNLGTSPTMYVDGAPSNIFLRDGKWHHYAAVGISLSIWTQLSVSNYPSWPIHGSLSSVRIWKGSMTQAEVKKAMDGALEGHNASLHAYWPLNEAEGNLVYDHSGNGHDGILYGGSWGEGRSMYSLAKDTPSEGGVLVEEETSNLIPNPSFEDGTIAPWVTEQSYLGVSVHKANVVTEDAIDSLYSTKIEVLDLSGSTDFHSYSVRGSFANTTTYPVAFSVFLKGTPGTSIGLRISRQTNDGTSTVTHYGGDETIHVRRVVTATGEWQRVSGIMQPYTGTNSLVGFHIRTGLYKDASTKVGHTAYIDAVQLETKPYVTSFVDGSRSVSNLRYPPSIINHLEEGTVSFWIKPAEIKSDTYQALIRAGKWGTGNSGWGILIYGTGSIYFEYGHVGTSTSTVYEPTASLEKDTWTFVTATWSAEGISIYTSKDGELQKASKIATLGAIDYLAPIGVGKNPADDSLQMNATFDELRIDKVARTEAEIQAWYYQGRNGW